MRLDIIKTIPNQRILWTNGDINLIAKGSDLVCHERNEPTHIVRCLQARWRKRILSHCCLSRQALRLGILNAWLCDDGGVLAIARGRILRAASTAGCLETCHELRPGTKPCFHGLDVLPSGVCFCGEYLLNHQRTEAIGLFRSTDKGHSFEKVFEFPASRVRHIHFVQWDPWDQCLWMGTGDRNHECLFMRSFDSGESWETVGGGSQLWRAGGVVFTEDYLYWGMDAGSVGTTPSFIVRMNRENWRPSQLVEVQGPCYSCGRLKNGTIVVGTGVEGGANEKDRCAHIWASRDGKQWVDLMSWKKNVWPFAVQFGAVLFPHGLETSDDLHFTTLGLKGGAETWHVARIVD